MWGVPLELVSLVVLSPLRISPEMGSLVGECAMRVSLEKVTLVGKYFEMVSFVVVPCGGGIS